MMKHIRRFGIAAAALAASAGLVSTSAVAQELAGAPRAEAQRYEQFRGGRDDDWRDRDDRYDRDRGRIDFQTAQRTCSRMGVQEAWNRNYYSAQYDGAPRLVDSRRGGWELRGRMRLHDRSGYRTVETSCVLRRGGEAVRFDFLR